MSLVSMDKIIALAKRRGFVFSSSKIYGGFANSYTYGPYGVELKNNIKKLWWQTFVHQRSNIVGVDGPILSHPKIWQASGHSSGFNDAMIDCKDCKKRFRADHLIEEATGEDMEGEIEKMQEVFEKEKIKCPECGNSNWTEPKNFNLMFGTQMNGVDEMVYLRPETAGTIFVEFKNIVDTMRVKIPFGIAQIGKAFRNEIVAGNFLFRMREFEQMEIEYFIHPKSDWETIFENWIKEQEEFAKALGAEKEDLRRYEHPQEKLSHYSKKTVDLEYKFPFGFKELCGLANRTDFDLTQHAKFSGENLEYYDTENDEKYIPHTLEPSFGVDRSFLVSLTAAYKEEETSEGQRVVMKIPHYLAPIKVAIFPLLKNKAELTDKAKQVYDDLRQDFVVEYDETGSIGKRYRRQDEIGTPHCVTIDFDSIKNNDVTVRDRDSMKQERVAISELKIYLEEKLKTR